MKKNIHPFLFSIYPILFLYSQNIDQTPVSSIILPLIISLAATLFLLVCLKKFMGNDLKSGVMVSIILFLFFSYGHFHSIIFNSFSESKLILQKIGAFRIEKSLLTIDIGLHIFLLLLAVLVLLRSYKLISNKKVHNVVSFLNITSIALFIFSTTYIFFYIINSTSFEQPKIETSKNHSIHQPDIYYIVLDGYARSDILEEFYGYKNELDPFLKKRGFFIPQKNYSNYALTYLSLLSSLNFNYLDYFKKEWNEDSTDRRLPYKLIESNQTMHLLRSMGYRYVHVSSTWGATLDNKYADLKINNKNSFFRDEYFRILIETTMLRILNSFMIDDLSKIHLYNFEKMSHIPDYDVPTFSFAHIIPPHPPYIFDKNGNIRQEANTFNQFKPGLGGGWKNSSAYIDQLIFVNKKIMEIIDNLQKKSTTQPIIIIQSDHGPYFPVEDMETFKRIRMSNYMAFYMPYGGSEYLYDEISPVNTFRIIFKHYFNKDIELLNDKSFFSTSNFPYKFEQFILE